MKMIGVSEYCEGYEVELIRTIGAYIGLDKQNKGADRWVIKAINEGGCNSTEVDVIELVAWLKENRPDLLS